jgi:hypothetical protein
MEVLDVNISVQSKALLLLDMFVSACVVITKRKEKCSILAEVVYTTQLVVNL